MPKLGRQTVVLRAGGYSVDTRVFPPTMAALLSAGVAAPEVVTAKFEVTYNGFSPQAKKAFQAAVDVWAVTLKTSVPIRVAASWTPLDAGVLGQAGPETFQHDFAGAAHPATWYPSALANKIAGEDLAPDEADISAEFSSVFENWYFGIDAQTPADQYDLMSVVLHELGHGLGFIGSATVAGGGGSWGWQGFPAVYDHFTEDRAGKKILDKNDFPNPSPALAGALQSNRLFFNGPLARMANGNNPVRIYAPIVWQGGSSYSHLNEETFTAGDSNSLMTPQIGMGEAIHAPGGIGLGVLRDLGW